MGLLSTFRSGISKSAEFAEKKKISPWSPAEIVPFQEMTLPMEN